MGGGASKQHNFAPKQKKSEEEVEYECKLRKIPKREENEPKTTIEEVKKNLLQKQKSHPELLNTKTVFCPYIDIKVTQQNATSLVQRPVSHHKASMIVGDGKLNYKKCEYFECSTKFPWLLKNAHFIRPDLKDFLVGRAIGAGRTSTVMLAETDRGKYCVLKSMKKDTIFKNNELKHILNEKETLYTLNSSFCTKLLAEFEDFNFAYFVLEYIPGGELKMLLRDYGTFPSEWAKFYMTEVLCALEHIHSRGIVYRDLRPENIAIDEEGHIKIIDFGSSIKMDYNLNGKLYTICCSAGYLSPEQLNSKFDGGYGKEVDLWQFAIVMYELMVGKTPFIKDKNDSKYEILLRILHHKMSFPSDFNPKAKDLVNKMLNPQIEKRLIEISEIKNHEFFTSFLTDWNDVEKRRLLPPYIPKIAAEGDSSNFVITEGSAKHWKLGVLENKIHLI